MTETVLIGGSTGAIDALATILPALPPGYPAPLVVVIHLPDAPSLLCDVLGARCALPVVEAEDKCPLRPGVVHVAPPGYHLLVERSRSLALSLDDPVWFSRPSIDVLFESAAWACGPAALGVLLAGASEDGARGLAAIKRAGGTAWVQSPGSASIPTLPDAALARMQPDLVGPPEALARALGARHAGASPAGGGT